MRAMKVIAPAFILALSSMSRAAPCPIDEISLRDECSAYSQAGMRECLAKHVAASEQALTAAEGRLKTALAKWDEDKKYVDLAKSRLLTATHAFPQGRDAQCAFASSLAGGAAGDSHEIYRLACVAEFNYLRARQLGGAVAGLEQK